MGGIELGFLREETTSSESGVEAKKVDVSEKSTFVNFPTDFQTAPNSYQEDVTETLALVNMHQVSRRTAVAL